MTEYLTRSEVETAALGARLAQDAQPGSVYALSGDLGAGKSAFARGFIQALSGAGEVPSPTFTLVQSYDSAVGLLYHFDLYRLDDADEVLALGWDDALAEGICLIEWPEKAGRHLPARPVRINITTLPDESRKIVIDDPRS